MREPLKVLYVEDSGSKPVALLRQLRAQGYEATCRPEPPKTMGRALEEQSWDVVLCRCGKSLAGMRRAIELVKGLDLPFIVLLDAAFEPAAIKAMKAGAHDVLSPASRPRLGQVIRREVEAARARASLRRTRQVQSGVAAEAQSRALSCLCQLSRSIEERPSTDELLHTVIALIPPAWQYPEIVCARIVFDGRPFATPDYVETAWKQTRPIVVRGAVRGLVEVGYRQTCPTADEGPFLREERILIDELARRMANVLDRIAAAARERHLHTVLSAIRKGSEAIVQAADPKVFVEHVCRDLATTHGVRAAWVYLNSQAPGGEKAVESGWGQAFQPLAARMIAGDLPRCCHSTLEQIAAVAIREPAASCIGCPLALHYDGCGGSPTEALAAPLVSGDRRYGCMCVSIYPDLALGEDKGSFLLEVADAITSTLRAIEVEEDRRRSEKALEQQAQRRLVLMDASSDGIAIINQQHQVVEANRRFAEQLGYTLDEATRLHTWDWEAVMTEAEIRVAFADLTKINATFETRHRRKDGTVFDVEVSACGTRVGDESMVFTVSRDITEKKNLQATLAQSDRLASMGMLAAGVAHEINNPLAYVLYNLESLKEDIPRFEKKLRGCREALESHLGAETLARILGDGAEIFGPFGYEDLTQRYREAVSGTHRIRDIVRSLGTFSRVEEDELGPINLHYTIECAANMAYNEIKYRAQLVKEFGSVARIMASEGRLSQVFLNLLINAAHAIDDGDADHNTIRIRTWQEGDEACVEVSDTGKGIPEENLDRIFDPFFSTKRVGFGSGLGLAITRTIITNYGGQIEVKSRVGEGTSFTVRLPIAQETVSTGWLEKDYASAEGEVRGRILVVDDEPGIRTSIRRMLNRHEVIGVASGEEGRELLDRDQAFDLILCDLLMPAMSGMDFHEWLTGAYPDLARRVVFITGGAFTPKARQYLAKVDNIRIDKPFEMDNLKKVALRVITQYRRQQ